MQEEEIKILSPLFLIANSWLEAFALINPLDSLGMCNTVLEAWAYCVPFSTPAESKSHPSISSKLCLRIFHLTSVAKKAKILTSSESEVTQSCLTLCDPVDCSLPGFSVHGIFLARVLEWVAISFSRGSCRPRDWTWISCIASRRFTLWAMREAQQ